MVTRRPWEKLDEGRRKKKSSPKPVSWTEKEILWQNRYLPHALTSTGSERVRYIPAGIQRGYDHYCLSRRIMLWNFFDFSSTPLLRRGSQKRRRPSFERSEAVRNRKKGCTEKKSLTPRPVSIWGKNALCQYYWECSPLFVGRNFFKNSMGTTNALAREFFWTYDAIFFKFLSIFFILLDRGCKLFIKLVARWYRPLKFFSPITIYS